MIKTCGCRKVAILSSLALLICFSFSNLSFANQNITADFFKKQDISKEDSKISPLITKSLKLSGQFNTLQSENYPVSKFSNPFIKINEVGFIQVYLHLSHISDEVISVLLENEFNLEIVNNDLNIVQGWVSQSKVFDISDLDFVTKITPPSYGITRQGSVITEGDPVLNSDDVREMFGIDGTGVKVGVISDGVDSLAVSKATGDLPNDVTVLKQGNGNEGTAMLETIHDIAPGAELAFSEGFSSSLAFMQSIDDLINICNVDIIVDDVGFLLEPYFQDGVVAQKVEEAISKGVIFVSAAGNSADEHYQNLYVDEDSTDDELNLHDFGLASQGSSAISMPILVGGTAFSPSNFIAVILQWNEPFGASSSDYDLFLFDEEGAQLDSSTVIQDGSQDPIEVVVFDNNSAENKIVELVINRFSGEQRVLEMQFNGIISIQDFNVPGDSIFGHAAASHTVAVGAVPVGNPDIIEPFSSLGPVSIFFNPVQVTNSLNSSSPLVTTSNNIPSEVRQKPDVVAPDFTNTSVDGFAPFPGSSVSGAHAAGVVALIIEAEAQAQSQVTSLNNQFNKINLVNDPIGIIDILKQNAVDLGAPGPDNIFGFGRVDALAAVQAVLPDPPPVMPPDDGGDVIVEDPPEPPAIVNNNSSGGCSLVNNSNYSGVYSSLFILLVVLSTVFINRFHKIIKRNS